MKLDRNMNPDGRGKYALVNMRKLKEADSYYDGLVSELHEAGILTFGNESPGDQFFVMKHKDVFTTHGLIGYGEAAMLRAFALKNEAANRREASEEVRKALREQSDSLEAYAGEIYDQAKHAERVASKLPD